MSGPFQITPTNLFQPTQISGCQLWLDAADQSSLVLSGSSVTQWRDKSGSGYTATGTVAPSYNNTTKYILFNGSTQFFTVSNGAFPSGNNPYSIFLVSFTNNAANPQWILAGGSEVTNQAIGVIFFTTNAIWHSWWVNEYRVDNSITNGVPAILNLSYNTTRTTIVNGGTATINSPGATRNNPTGPNYIGRRITSSQYLDGGIGEILIFNSEIPTSQRQQVEGYLAWKWGFQGNLPSNHPYKNTPVYSQTVLPFPTVIPPSVLTVTGPRAATNLPTFLPTQISDCSLWLDAADSNSVVLSGSNVTQWNDKSGNGYNFVRQGSFALPVLSNNAISSNGAISFTGNNIQNDSANQILTNSSFPLNSSASGYSIFTLTQQNVSHPSYTGYNYIISAYGGGAGSGLFYGTEPNGYLLTANGTAGAFYGFNDLTANIPNTLMTTAIQTSIVVNGSVLSPYLNGSSMTAKTGTCVALTGISIGNAYAPGQTFTGQTWGGVIGEVIIYNKAVSTSERQQLEGYLAWKWGLVASLPNGHPYKVPPLAPFSYAVRQAAQVSFSPLFITGCQLWVDATDRGTITLSGSNTVTSLRDKSSNSYTLSNASGFTYTTSGFNGKPSFSNASTSGGPNLGSNTSFNVSTPLSIFFVGSKLNAAEAYVVDGYLNSLNRVTVAYLTIPPLSYFMLATANISTPASWAGSNLLLASIFDGASSAGYTSGSLAMSGNTGSPMPFGGIILGSRFSLVSPWDGQYCEMIIYNTALTTSQRQQVEGYLAWKWGLVGNLPANHPYKNFPPK